MKDLAARERLGRIFTFSPFIRHGQVKVKLSTKYCCIHDCLLPVRQKSNQVFLKSEPLYKGLIFPQSLWCLLDRYFCTVHVLLTVHVFLTRRTVNLKVHEVTIYVIFGHFSFFLIKQIYYLIYKVPEKTVHYRNNLR